MLRGVLGCKAPPAAQEIQYGQHHEPMLRAASGFGGSEIYEFGVLRISGFGVWGLGLGFRGVWGFGAQGLGLWVWNLWFL